jgi:alpha/beta hydrolase fold
MTAHTSILSALAVSALVGCSSAHGQTPAKQHVDPAVAKLGVGFASRTANVNGAKIHYVRGGTGPAVFLVHGFPQDWYAFHKIMPRLAKSFTVIAVDTRGVGGSTAPPGGFDATNIAGDIHQLARHLSSRESTLRATITAE